MRDFLKYKIGGGEVTFHELTISPFIFAIISHLV